MEKWSDWHTHRVWSRLAGHCYSAVIRGLWVSEPPSTAVLFLPITWPICQQPTPPRWTLRWRERCEPNTAMVTHKQTHTHMCGSVLFPERHTHTPRVLNIERLIFYVCHSIKQKFLLARSLSLHSALNKRCYEKWNI